MAGTRVSNRRRIAVAVSLATALLALVGAATIAAATNTRFPTVNAAVTVPLPVDPLASPENAYADDGVYATGNLDAKIIGGIPTGGGFAHGFGDFGFDAIPPTAVITSVTAEMQYKFTETTGTVDSQLLVFSGGSLLATARASSLPTTDTVLATAPFAATRDQLLDGALVVEVSGTSGDAGTVTQSMLIDYVSATVTYTVPEPTIAVPPDITRTATSAAGAVVTFEVTSTDDQDGALVPTCAPPSGSVFAVGTTTVTCTVTDSDQNTATASFAVTVLPPGAPVPTLPPTSTADPELTGTPAGSGLDVLWFVGLIGTAGLLATGVRRRRA